MNRIPALILSAALALATTGLAADAQPARPNIILVMADDQGWGDTSYNGHPELKTPDRIQGLFQRTRDLPSYP